MSEKPFTRNKPYTGPIQAVILDWAGTAIDCGCRGPVAVFTRAFERFGILPTTEEVRQPMGREKREHVAAMLAMPRLADLWAQKHGARPDDADVSAVFAAVQEFMPDTLADYAQPVPGCVDAMNELRKRGIKIGSCTGYSRSMMTRLLPKAEAAGYRPDALVTADDVPNGRPWPWMCWQNCMKLGVFPPESVIKCGDTVADIEEGINAGHWSVAVVRTSNAIGLDEDDLGRIAPDKLAAMESNLKDKFLSAGAHYVVSSVADLPWLCGVISERMASGESPLRQLWK